MEKSPGNQLLAIISYKKSLFKLLTTGLITVILFGITVKSNAQSSSLYLLALSKADHTLAIVDPATLKVIARVPVGTDPHEVIASSDGKIAYVSI